MNNFSFEAGVSVRLNGRGYLVERCAGHSVELKDTETEASVTYKRADLSAAFRAGKLQINDLLAGGESELQNSAETIPKGLSEYSERERSEAVLRRGLLLRLCPRGAMTVPRAKLSQAIQDAWSKLPASAGKRAPSVSTFYAWRKRWRACDGRDEALVSQYALRGRRPAQLPAGLAPIIEQAVDRVYLSDNRGTVSATLDDATELVNLQNKMRSPLDQLPRPTRRQIERQIAKIDRFLLLERRHGRKVARARTAVYGAGPGAERLLERVEIDHTPMDIICISEDTKTVLGRPWLTVIIDVASRMVLAIWISFRTPSANTILRTLKQAILPKDGIIKRYGLKGEWPARGVPIAIVSDNGAEFHSNALDAAALDLGMTVIYCPKQEPRFKGVIERFMKTVNYSFVHTLPGTTFGAPDQRGEYDSEAKAVLTIDELRELVYKWVVEVYSLQYHRGIQACPFQKWRELEPLSPPVLPRRPEVLDVMLRPIQERVLSSKGIEINSLFYNDGLLSDLRLRLGNVTLSVRANADNLGSIEVLHPETGTYFTALCTDSDYAECLTLEQHELFKRVKRRDYQALSFMAGVRAAKHEMRESVEAIIARRTPSCIRDTGNVAATTPKKLKTKASRARKHCETEMLSATAKQASGEDVVSGLPRTTVAPHELSFDDVDAFPSGQADLFTA